MRSNGTNGKPLIYWSGHHCLGDCFLMAAAGHLRYRETGREVSVCFCPKFEPLAGLFDGISWLDENIYVHDRTIASEYDIVDYGVEPEPFFRFNGVTRFLPDDRSSREDFMGIEYDIFPECALLGHPELQSSRGGTLCVPEVRADPTAVDDQSPDPFDHAQGMGRITQYASSKSIVDVVG